MGTAGAESLAWLMGVSTATNGGARWIADVGRYLVHAVLLLSLDGRGDAVLMVVVADVVDETYLPHP